MDTLVNYKNILTLCDYLVIKLVLFCSICSSIKWKTSNSVQRKVLVKPGQQVWCGAAVKAKQVIDLFMLFGFQSSHFGFHSWNFTSCVFALSQVQCMIFNVTSEYDSFSGVFVKIYPGRTTQYLFRHFYHVESSFSSFFW